MGDQLSASPLFESTLRDVLAMLAHDLRTPLHGILGFLEVLAHTEMDSAQRGSLAAARMCGEDLLETLNGILDGIDAETGGVAARADWNDLRDVLCGIAAVFEPQAALHGIRFRWSVNPDVPRWWRFDRCKLRQILANLLGNALKFTRSGGVSLEARLDAAGDGALTILVTDTGEGIPESVLQRVVDSQDAAHPFAGRRGAGNGLGLVIVRKLTGLLGGTVRFSSVEGVGSEVALRFPWQNRSSPVDASLPAARQPRGPREFRGG